MKNTNIKLFKGICKLDQKTLKAYLYEQLCKVYPVVIKGDGYVYAKGNDDCPVLLTAHMDTVHKETCRKIQEKHEKGKTILSSPQGIGGDDRCGIYMILAILCETKYRPSILFCEDEEIGGVGSDKFTKTASAFELIDCKYFIELDRKGDNDAVYYDCGNEDFQEYIEETIGYKEAWGSFSDISHLSPATDVASVNLSCGYYNAHTLQEYVVFEEMENTKEKVKVLLADIGNVDKFDYQEVKYSRYENYFYGGRSYNYSDYIDDYGYGYGYKSKEKKSEDKNRDYEIIFNNPEIKEEDTYYVTAVSYKEALGLFMIDNPNACYFDIIDSYEYPSGFVSSMGL